MSPTRVDRRLAAILAADVAAYSRLIGAEKEGTLARLKAIRKPLTDPKIAEHRGRIVKTTGDGLLSSLPVPSMRRDAPSKFSAAWRDKTPLCRSRSGLN